MLDAKSSSQRSAAVIAALAAATSAVVAALLCSRRRRAHDAQIARLEDARRAERTGRIRAEIKLRTHLKQQAARSLAPTHADGGTTEGDAATPPPPQHGLLLHCIGTVVSPYTKRMGTPRQGALVPSGRGFIELRIPVECVDGLEGYSHAWVLFTFHANTDAPTAATHQLNLSKTKIRPPRGQGRKVGMLATRSPHRPNNIGLSLVRVVRVDAKRKRVHIAALDLVHGTPVYDLKPCVPWDVPGHHDRVPLSVPGWVSQEDALRSVAFSPRATAGLARCLREGKALAPLYTEENEGLAGAASALREVLAQDPRASNSNGRNKRGSGGSGDSGADRSAQDETYKMLFCAAEVEFRVDGEGVIVENVGSGPDLTEAEYVDGIPVLLEKGR